MNFCAHSPRGAIAGTPQELVQTCLNVVNRPGDLALTPIHLIGSARIVGATQISNGPRQRRDCWVIQQQPAGQLDSQCFG